MRRWKQDPPSVAVPNATSPQQVGGPTTSWPGWRRDAALDSRVSWCSCGAWQSPRSGPMKRRQTLTGSVMFALVFGTAPAVAQQSAGPLEPIGVVVDALRKSPIVALGEVHGNEQCQQFRLALLRDVRVTDLVNDIVVEFGNAKYQDVVDSFVAGGNVGDAELRHVWQDTTQ